MSSYIFISGRGMGVLLLSEIIWLCILVNNKHFLLFFYFCLCCHISFCVHVFIVQGPIYLRTPIMLQILASKVQKIIPQFIVIYFCVELFIKENHFLHCSLFYKSISEIIPCHPKIKVWCVERVYLFICQTIKHYEHFVLCAIFTWRCGSS